MHSWSHTDSLAFQEPVSANSFHKFYMLVGHLGSSASPWRSCFHLISSCYQWYESGSVTSIYTTIASTSSHPSTTAHKWPHSLPSEQSLPSLSCVTPGPTAFTCPSLSSVSLSCLESGYSEIFWYYPDPTTVGQQCSSVVGFSFSHLTTSSTSLPFAYQVHFSGIGSSLTRYRDWWFDIYFGNPFLSSSLPQHSSTGAEQCLTNLIYF